MITQVSSPRSSTMSVSTVFLWNPMHPHEDCRKTGLSHTLWPPGLASVMEREPALHKGRCCFYVQRWPWITSQSSESHWSADNSSCPSQQHQLQIHSTICFLIHSWSQFIHRPESMTVRKNFSSTQDIDTCPQQPGWNSTQKSTRPSIPTLILKASGSTSSTLSKRCESPAWLTNARFPHCCGYRCHSDQCPLLSKPSLFWGWSSSPFFLKFL